jgi:nitrate reductase gamma subunit
MDLLELARGPLFTGALLFFIGGMVYRLVTVIGMGWRRNRVPSKKNPTVGAGISLLKGWLIFPFWPRVRSAFVRNPVIYIAGFVFHLGLFLIIFFGAAHMLVWKDLLGFGWPTIPLPFIDGLTVAAILALIALFFNRLAHPVVRKLTGPGSWLNLLFVALPFITAFMLAHGIGPRYERMFAIHVLTVDWLLVWIPLSRISHFVFYFFSRTNYGAQYARRGATS